MAHRLLLADDSVTIQRVIELTFAEEGVDVVAVGDGRAAMAQLAAGPFDVVLADIGMPAPNGFDIAASVQARESPVPVVLLTGAFDALDEARVAAVGAAAVLVKPFEPQVAIAKVRELLGRAPAVRPAPAVPPPTPAPAAAADTPARSADEYFDRLDKAFASLNATLEPREAGRPSVLRHHEPEAAPVGNDAASATSTPTAAPDTPEGSGARLPVSRGLADTFATLLAVEQGELPPSALAPRPAGEDELVDRIARRVVEQLGDRAVRALAADVVSRTAERLVREEIERIKTGS
jgi:DNA-binding response OmpR family regulator